MKRRDMIRLVPLTLAGIGSSAFGAVEGDRGRGFPEGGPRGPQGPLSLQYARTVRDMLAWVKETQ